MKRTVIVLIVAIVAIGAVSAQAFGARPGVAGQPVQPAIQQVAATIEGKLALVQGHPALVVKEKTYFLRMPQYLFGFVDGLKEGATVKLEGFETAIPYAPNSFFFSVSTLTIGAKSYDLSQVGAGLMGGARGGMMGGMMGGRAAQSSAGNGQMGGRGRW
jgi:hypothetical protein